MADPQPGPGDVFVRLARRSDAGAIRRIYNHEVTESTVVFDLVPRTLDAQVEWIDEHSGAHPALVAVDDSGEVLGFGSLSRYRSRPAYATTVEDSVYVRADVRGRGVGSALLSELVATATANGFHTVIARIVGANDASIALHRRCGFELVGVEREVGRKFGRWLDVVVMQRMLGSRTSPHA
jgi:phosphinothricin acetyltransferase